MLLEKQRISLNIESLRDKTYSKMGGGERKVEDINETGSVAKHAAAIHCGCHILIEVW